MGADDSARKVVGQCELMALRGSDHVARTVVMSLSGLPTIRPLILNTAAFSGRNLADEPRDVIGDNTARVTKSVQKRYKTVKTCARVAGIVDAITRGPWTGFLHKG